MRPVECTVPVDAPAGAVWSVLTDVEAWPGWTASMTSLRRIGTGPLRVGEQVVVRQPRLPTTTWTVTAVDEGRSFTWSAGAAGVHTVADHVLVPVAGGCLVTVRVTQLGRAAPLARLLLGRTTRRYVRMEAEGLKACCESRVR